MAYSDPLVQKADVLAEELSVKLSSSVSHWVMDGSTGIRSWNRLMVRELQEDLVSYLVEDYSVALRARGLEPLSREAVVVLVRRALMDTEDLRRRLLTAPGGEESLTAAFSLSALVGRVHQLGIVKSLMRFLQGETELEIVSGMDGYTGRRRWRTSESRSGSRHGHLNFAVAEAGEGFFIAPGVVWFAPRQNIQQVEHSSNCLCWLEYEFVDDSGVLSWR